MIFNKLITSEDTLLELINNDLISKNKLLVTYFNQHCFNIYQKEKIYKKLIEEQFLVFVDGTGIFWTYKLFNRKSKIKRFNATDIYNKLFEVFKTKAIKVYIIGGNFPRKLVYSSTEKINVVGYNSGFFPENNLKSIIEEVENLGPDVVVVGMGVPKQEFLAYELSEKIEKNIIYLCVGNFLEFFFNTQKRAPLILRNIGMEWFFRLITEPRRLWKRYLLGIPLYFINILRYKYFNS